jgi:hypothetical protein
MRAVLPAPVRVKVAKPTAAERQAVYDYVTARDVTCRMPFIEDNPWHAFDCSDGRLERHHAGIGIGSNRNELTDSRHVVLLCNYHHRTWAPSHSRMILEWLARIEDAKEKA